MSDPRIAIIGAGTAGLALGRCLKARGRPFTVYEKSSRISGHRYGITLDQQTLSKLCQASGISSQALLAASALQSHGYHQSQDSATRASRHKFETYLADGLDVRLSHVLESVTTSENNTTLKFTNGTTISPTLIVDTTGIHSPIRSALLPSIKPTIHPYAVYSGRRSIPWPTYAALYAPHLNHNLVITVPPQKPGEPRLEISLADDVQPESDVSIRYTYSRPSRSDGQDPLARADRANAAATETPSELFDEIQRYLEIKQLDAIWRDAFDVAQMKKDRVLHWLMRSVLMPRADAETMVEERGVVMLGDAVHGTPILGGRGANVAVEDGVGLADVIDGVLKEGGDGSRLRDVVKGWVGQRYGAWEAEIQGAKARIEAMHAVQVGQEIQRGRI